MKDRGGRPREELRRYADELGLKGRQVQKLGGVEAVKAMPEDARQILVNMAKRARKLKEAA